MKLQRFEAQKLAIKNGLFLGSSIFILNCILTFIYLDVSLHNILSYTTLPLIAFFAGYTGYRRMKQTEQLAYAIQSSILAVTIGLLIGFGTLYLLTHFFMDTILNNPITIRNFQLSGQGTIESFVYRSIIDAITISFPTSIILGIISGASGAALRKRR